MGYSKKQEKEPKQLSLPKRNNILCYTYNERMIK